VKATVTAEAFDVGAGPMVRVECEIDLEVPGESGTCESVLVVPAGAVREMIRTVIAALLEYGTK